MEVVLGLLFIAGLLALVWVKDKVVAKTSSTINRKVNRREHEQGRALLREPIFITGAHVSVTRAVSAVIQELNVFDEPSPVKQRVWTQRLEPDHLRITFGTRFFTGWCMDLLFTDSDGLLVMSNMVEATEVDGVMPGSRELGLVHERTKAAIAKLSQTPTAEANP